MPGILFGAVGQKVLQNAFFLIVQVRRNLLESSSRDGDDVEVSIEVPEGGDVPSGLSAQERQLAAAFN